MIRTNKDMKKVGDFPTRTPKKEDFTEYVYSFADGTKTVISRDELNPDVDELMYEELKKEVNNNEVQIEKHRGYAKDSQDYLFDMKPSEVDLEKSVIDKLERSELRDAISSLQPQQQDLIFKKYFQNKSNTDIAKEECVTESAIRDRLRKIHKRLEKKL